MGNASNEVVELLASHCDPAPSEAHITELVADGLDEILHHFHQRSNEQLSDTFITLALGGSGSIRHTAIQALRKFEDRTLRVSMTLRTIAESETDVSLSAAALVALGQTLTGSFDPTNQSPAPAVISARDASLAVLERFATARDRLRARAAACGLALAWRELPESEIALLKVLREPRRVVDALIDAEARGAWRERQNTEEPKAFTGACDWFRTLAAEERRALLEVLFEELFETRTRSSSSDLPKWTMDDDNRAIALLVFLSELSEHIAAIDLVEAAYADDAASLAAKVCQLCVDDARAQRAVIELCGNFQQFTREVAAMMFAVVDSPLYAEGARRAARKMRHFAHGSLDTITAELRSPHVGNSYCATQLLGELGGSVEMSSAERTLAGDHLAAFLHDPLAHRDIYLFADDGIGITSLRGKLSDATLDALVTYRRRYRRRRDQRRRHG